MNTKTEIPTLTARMTSLEIADLVHCRHDSVKRTIERLVKRRVIVQPPLVEVACGTSGPNPKIYVFDEAHKLDSVTVVARLSTHFTALLVKRWDELETRVRASAPAVDKETIVRMVAAATAEAVAPIRRDVSRALNALSWEQQRRAHLTRKYIESLEQNQKGYLPVTEARLKTVRACAAIGLSRSEAVRQTRLSPTSVKRIYRGEWPIEATARPFASEAGKTA